MFSARGGGRARGDATAEVVGTASIVHTAASSSYLCAANGSRPSGSQCSPRGGPPRSSATESSARARPPSAGEMTGTMALTEPHAGSSLGDITTRATPWTPGRAGRHGLEDLHLGGEHDLTDNIVLVLARVEGAPAGTCAACRACRSAARRGLHDVRCAGVLHKIGWRALPSVVLQLRGGGRLPGMARRRRGRGLAQMFQMMNAAPLRGVGASAAATAYVAYQEALRYARSGPPSGGARRRVAAGADHPHPDVRRMLLRQKAIVEGPSRSRSKRPAADPRARPGREARGDTSSSTSLRPS